MTPQQKIKLLIINEAIEDGIEFEHPEIITEDNISDVYSALDEADECAIQDISSEIRQGDVETDLECEWSRHYECKAVASKMSDGSWVGWTYWYGGGKHGEPDSIEWIEYAYDLDVKEEEKMVLVRTFKKITK